MGRSVTGSSSGNAFLTTASPIGFTTGDFVYQTNQGLGRVPDTAVSTASFSVSSPVATSPLLSQPNAGLLKYVEYYGGMNTANAVAQLTNGNIAIAYGKRDSGASTNAYIYFKILDTSDNTVVAETAVSTTANYLNNGGAIGCLALPNGKFAVIWNGYQVSSSTYYLSYAIYNADGTVSTAATQLTTYVGAPDNQLAFAARSDSSFVVSFYNSAGAVVYYVISAAGALVYNGNTGSGSRGTGINSQLSVTVRSDDSFALFFCGNALAAIYYYVYSSTNSLIVGTNFSATGGAAGYSAKSFLLPSGDIAFVYSTSNNAAYFRTFSTGNVLSSETTLFSYAVRQYGGFSANVINGSGDFMVVWSYDPYTTGATGTTRLGKAFYRVFNSSGTALTSATEIRAINNHNQGATIQILPVGSSIRLYKSSATGPATTSTYYWPRGIYYAKINSTSYALEPFSSVTQVGGTSTASVSGYVRSSSSISSASFFAATTQTLSASVGPSTSTTSTQLLPQTLIESQRALAASCCTLQNGDIAVAYKLQAFPYAVKLAIYNSAGVQQTLITVASSGAGYYGLVQVIQLTNGKIVVVYNSTVSSVTGSIYSSSYSLLTTVTSTTVYGSGEEQWTVSPIGQNSLFILGYKNASQYMRYDVFNDSGTKIVSDGTTSESTYVFSTVAVCGLRSGDFVIWGPSGSSGTLRYYLFGRTADNSYAQCAVANVTGGGTSPYYYFNNVSVTPDDFVVVFGGGSSGDVVAKLVTAGLSTTNNSGSATTTSYYNSSTGTIPALGTTGNGDPLVASSNTTAQPLRYGLLPVPSGLDNSAVITNSSTSFTNLSATAYPGSFNPISISPYNGDAFVATYLDSNEYPVIGIYYANSSTFSTTITAGVTPSVPVTIGYSNGFSLVGIAISNCSAGGAGIVQTSGTAVVSNTYPSVTSQSFDFRNRTALGVNGTISGRIVTIEG